MGDTSTIPAINGAITVRGAHRKGIPCFHGFIQHVVAARVSHRPAGNGRGHPGARRGWTVV